MTDESPLETLIRRADAYAHSQYYGQGLADCITDNQSCAEQARRETRRQALNEAAAVLRAYPDYPGVLGIAAELLKLLAEQPTGSDAAVAAMELKRTLYGDEATR